VDASTQAAFRVHVAALVVGFLVLLFLVRHQWFLYDDWAFTGSIRPHLEHGDVLGFLFNPYNGHWVTVQNLLQEATYSVVGMRSYLPYVIPTLIFDVIVAAEIRVVMRRAGVGPWLATGASTLLLVLGPAAGVVPFGVDFSFVAPLAFGLGMLLVTDHDGPLDRRDAWGVGLGLLALMSSSIGLATVAAVGFNFALRRRWRALAVTIGPLAVAWIVWYLTYGTKDTLTHADGDQLWLIPDFTWRGIAATMDALTQLSGLAPFLVVGVLVVAAVLGISPSASRTSTVFALAAGGVLFYVTVAYDRIPRGQAYAEQERFVFVAAVFVLPLVAVVLARAVEHVPRLIPVGAALLVWALVANLAVLVPRIEGPAYRGAAESMRARVLGVATQPHLGFYGKFAPFGLEGDVLTVAQVKRLKVDGEWPDLSSVSEVSRLDGAAVLRTEATEQRSIVGQTQAVPLLSIHNVELVAASSGCVTATATASDRSASFVLDTRHGYASIHLESPAGGSVYVQLRRSGVESIATAHPLRAGAALFLAVDVPRTTTVISLAALASLSLCNVRVPPKLLSP
jgi:hypothetical protein